MGIPGLEVVEGFAGLLQELLLRAESVKQTNTVEPPLNKEDLSDVFEKVYRFFSSSASSAESKRHNSAIVEKAVRDVYNSILASTTIDMPSFVQMWNLFDVVAMFCDARLCDSPLLFLLVEELLESQIVAGCKKIFDYLDSRREKLVAKDFGSKQLVILRGCNELLRRLSRAEDTAFCGRVFIFLFQTFPLGDKSAVNLRGAYHTENVTTFDKLLPRASEVGSERMEIDGVSDAKATPAPSKTEEPNSGSKGVTFSKAELMSIDELYPIFWSLQESLNQPKRLFVTSNFDGFKSGVEATMARFKSAQADMNGRPSKAMDESKKGTKRKRSNGEDDLANAFNPKYLTSRDLFELQIKDLAFRRHISVQLLIVLDFLLSLSVKAKEKLSKAQIAKPNESVIYSDQSLNDADTKWASDMKRSIADYLKQGYEGPYFYRMVDNVLSRDKNWVRWKIESCPAIAKPAVSSKEYVAAKEAACKATTSKKLRPHPARSLDLKFLSETDGRNGLERLKNPSRYQVPDVKSFRSKIELDDLDIDMAQDDKARDDAIQAKASKSWRALRIATATKFTSFDKIDSADKIDGLFQDHASTEELVINGDEEVGEIIMPEDRRPIVISGPSGVGKGTLITMLMGKHSKILGKKASHTTRPPREGEVNGQHYHFVTKEEYDVLRDGDQFLELNNFNGNDYGTSRKIVEGIIAQGMVPIMEMDMHGIQQLKDQGYSARFIFLQPPNMAELSQRLRQRGLDSDDKIEARLEIAVKELQQAQQEGFHDKIFVNDDLEKTYEQLEQYIFGTDEATREGGEEASEVVIAEVEMTDEAPVTEDEPAQEEVNRAEEPTKDDTPTTVGPITAE